MILSAITVVLILSGIRWMPPYERQDAVVYPAWEAPMRAAAG
jgi:hypothetical protein